MNDFGSWVEANLHVPYLDVSIDPDNPDIQPILEAVAPGMDASQFHCKRMTDGITNVVLKWRTESSLEGYRLTSPFLIRVYGCATEMFIDRRQELLNHKRLHAIDRAQPIFAVLQNGYVYGYCLGRPAGLSDFTSPEISQRIARSLGEIHRRVPVSAEEQPHMFAQIHSWLDNVPERYESAAQREMFRNNVDLQAIRNAAKYFERLVEERNPDTCFCHNDLLCHNVIITDSDKDVLFIDYEYGGINYSAYDIANHFNEFAGLEIETIDYARYPSEAFQRQWVTAYLRARGKEPSADRVKTLLEDIAMFSHVSHLYWGAWALVQAAVSTIDFDYLEYAVIRFRQLPRASMSSYP